MTARTAPPSAVLASARAYQRKAELGGGYRGVAFLTATKERRQGEVRQTLAEARNDAKRHVYEMLGARRYSMTRPGYIWGRSSWACNYWGDPS